MDTLLYYPDKKIAHLEKFRVANGLFCRVSYLMNVFDNLIKIYFSDVNGLENFRVVFCKIFMYKRI